MPAYFFVQEGPNAGAVHPLDADVIVVGRGDDCAVRVDDTYVSRRHFQVERVGEEHFLVDIGSRNAPLLNGTPQRARTKLQHGDEIVVGSTRLRFSAGAPFAPGKSSDALETAGYVPANAAERGSVAPAIVGGSVETKRVIAFVERAAKFDVTVLVTGESGTGKELIARALHDNSARSSGPMVTLNCAAIPRELVESELFGHEKGAFTGAVSQHIGKFEKAHGGTLFLDEIGELPPAGQAKLLRVLEDRKITRVGGSREIAVDVRIVAATNRDLHAMSKEGEFRLDLVYRLEVAHVHVAPLRDRRDDIEPIARHLLARCEVELRRGPLAFSDEALARLRAHDWPGNVRELRNVVDRSAIFSPASLIGAESLALRDGDAAAATPDEIRAISMEETIRAQVERALAETGGNKKKAAELLKISRSSLYNYMERFKLK